MGSYLQLAVDPTFPRMTKQFNISNNPLRDILNKDHAELNAKLQSILTEHNMDLVDLFKAIALRYYRIHFFIMFSRSFVLIPLTLYLRKQMREASLLL